MKLKKHVLPLFLTLFLLGCYEVNQDIVINENGSGTFSTHMDLAQMIEMMQSFAGDEMDKEGLDKVIDTVINMSSFVDTAKNISEEERKLLEKGKMRMQMNLKEKKFIIDTDFPFSNYSQLQSLMGETGGMSALTNVMKSMFDKGKEEAQPDSPKEPDLDEIGSVFVTVAKDGTLSKKLDKAKYESLMSRPEMAQMKEVSSAGIEILYTTTIKLPRPLKSADNPLIKVSDDKKTLTLKYNYLELFENPDKFSYTITF